MQSNRKDKVLYELWMTKDEERVLLEHIKSLPSLVWMVIKKAYKRGDFKKNGN